MRTESEAGLDHAVDQLISIYREVIAKASTQTEIDRGAEARATSRYLRWLSPILKDRYTADAMARQVRGEGGAGARYSRSCEHPDRP